MVIEVVGEDVELTVVVRVVVLVIELEKVVVVLSEEVSDEVELNEDVSDVVEVFEEVRVVELGEVDAVVLVSDVVGVDGQASFRPGQHSATPGRLQSL